MGRVLVVDGTRFKSVREACKRYDVSYSKVLRRMKFGMSLEESIKTLSRADFGRREIVIDGIKFSSLKDACIYYNLNYYTVSNKVRCGIPVEEAIKGSNPMKERKELWVDGVRYSTVREACEKYGAVYSTVITRMRGGKSLEEAIKAKSDGRCKKVVIDGREFKSVSEACRYYGVDYGYVRYQVRKGLDLEDAIRVVRSKYSLFKI